MGLQQIPSKSGVPSGNTAARPGNPVIGDTYYDGTIGFLVIYDGTNWIPCSAPASQPSITVTDIGTNIAYGTVQASVAFTEGTTGGKAAGFTATQGSTSATQASSPIVLTITGNPGSYSFTGTAYNGFGTSPSATSVTQSLTSLPQAPTIGTLSATGESGKLSLTFTAGATGGKSISNYKYSTDGTTYTAFSPAQTTSPLTISGLTNGTSYSVTLKAVNANGDSLASSTSNSATPLDGVLVTYLVVAGGGGGAAQHGAGGGGGGYRTNFNGTAVALSPSTNYTVTVGAGGAAGPYGTNPVGGNGSKGSNSVFNTITSTGGGYGGAYQNNNGGAGGSGGGGGNDTGTGGAGNEGSYTPVEGYAGGNSAAHSTGGGSGGGGGSSAVGSNATTSIGGGNAGAGTQNNIDGNNYYWAGGGGGGCISRANSNTKAGNGGIGGGGGAGHGDAAGDTNRRGTGGGSAINSGADGSIDTGGTSANAIGGAGGTNSGGGGGGSGHFQAAPGAGGKGIVILKYLDSRTITIGAGLTGTTASPSGGYKVTTITNGSGNVSWA